MGLEDLKLDDLKTALLQKAKEVIDADIFALYPLDLQIDYCTGVNGDLAAKNAMVDYIRRKRSDFNTIQTEISRLNDKDFISEFAIEDDDDAVRAVIETRMNLIDEHKDIVVDALKNVKGIFGF